MKEICIEAKQRISNCMLASSSGNGSPVSTSWRSTHLHNPPMRSTSAYDSMERPFRWDKKRGRWANSADFYFACTCHAFSSMIFSEILVHALMFGGWKFLLLSYSLAIAFYALPTFIIQTFLGQFSTSGSISAFRVSPIFKGIGYSILLVNITTVPYYIITSAVPFVYAVHSLHNTLPWMSCNNTWNTANCSVHDKYNAEDDIQDPHSTVEFFRSVISSTSKDASAITISWSILLGALIVGFVAIAILLKHVSFIGKVLRCICVLMFGFFLAIFANVLIQQKLSLHNFEEYLHPMLENSTEGIFGAVRCAMLMATFVLGPGWGSVITLSSYNSFRTDSERLSLWICLTHVLICLMALLAGSVAFDHFELHVGMLHWHVEEEHFLQFLYLCYAYFFGSLSSLPNLWSFLFFSIVFLAEFCCLVIQVVSVLTALFDEFEQLRSKKDWITVGIGTSLIAVSIYFCTQQGFRHLDILPNVGLLTHIFLSVVLLLMTTWVYGRERFQSDLQFMLGKTISNFKIFLIRFITPVLLLFFVIEVLYFFERDELHQALPWIIQCIVFLIAIIYILYKVCQTSGSWPYRLTQLFAPHDWHPVDADNRRFYEEIMGTSEMLVIDNTNL